MKNYLIFLFVLLFPFAALAVDLSNDSLAGKWMFTHMILDGESERSVNRLMEFLPKGEIINYDSAGQEKSRAAFSIQQGNIIYSDKRGAQNWVVKKFSADSLHVDHSGAEMFFKRK